MIFSLLFVNVNLFMSPVFFLCSLAATDVSFHFVFLQYPGRLPVEGYVFLFQPDGKIFVSCTFGNAEYCRRLSDCSTSFCNISAYCHCPFAPKVKKKFVLHNLSPHIIFCTLYADGNRYITKKDHVHTYVVFNEGYLIQSFTILLTSSATSSFIV